MKKVILIFVLALATGLWSATNAQMWGGMMNDSSHWSGMHSGMMTGNMMGNNMGYGMMNSNFMMMHNRPILNCFSTIYRLPGMQEELSLTDDQVNKLIDLQADFKKQDAGLSADLTKKQLKLKNLIESNAATKDVSEQIKSCSATMTDISVTAYDTASKMKNLLNDSQKKKLDELIRKHKSGNPMGNIMMMNQ